MKILIALGGWIMVSLIVGTLLGRMARAGEQPESPSGRRLPDAPLGPPMWVRLDRAALCLDCSTIYEVDYVRTPACPRCASQVWTLLDRWFAGRQKSEEAPGL